VNIRQSAVAGLFYPDSKNAISQFIDSCSSFTDNGKNEGEFPRAVIVPHAGFIYSGCAAYNTLKLWQGAKDKIKTIVMVGPAHRVAFHGVATVSSEAFSTPMGAVKIDVDLRDRLLGEFDYIGVSDLAHRDEHCLEVELPFIQQLLPEAKIVPLLNGSVEAQKVFDVLERLWREEGVYFLISSDLSHFHTYEDAQKIDLKTAMMVDKGEWQALSGEMACGYKGIQGLLKIVETRGLTIERTALLNSGDTAGDKQRVVGYGSWAVYDKDVH